MGRKKKVGFSEMKMLSSRVEKSDYDKFEAILKHRDGKKLQELLNVFIRNYISGAIYLSGSGFGVKSEQENV